MHPAANTAALQAMAKESLRNKVRISIGGEHSARDAENCALHLTLQKNWALCEIPRPMGAGRRFYSQRAFLKRKYRNTLIAAIASSDNA